MKWANNIWTYPNYDFTHKKNSIQNCLIFLIENAYLSASIESLNSSLVQLASKLWLNMLASFCTKILAHVGLKVRPVRPITTTFLTRVCNFLQLHNSLVDWASELFKPFTDSESLLVDFEKNIFILGLGFSVGDVIMGACLCHFMTEVTWPWVSIQQAIFWLKLFLESRLSSESLEPLIGLLAYLEPKLWPKDQKLVRIIFPQMLTLGILCPWP